MTKEGPEPDTYSENDGVNPPEVIKKDKKGVPLPKEQNKSDVVEKGELNKGLEDPKEIPKQKEGEKTPPKKRVSQTKTGFSFKINDKQ